MIVFALIAAVAMNRGTGLARELKACQQERLDYSRYINKELCSLGRKLGRVLDGCQTEM